MSIYALQLTIEISEGEAEAVNMCFSAKRSVVITL